MAHVIPVNVANVTDVADVDRSYHFGSSESLHNRLIESKSWISVNNWDSCRIRDSQTISLQTAQPWENRCTKLQR